MKVFLGRVKAPTYKIVDDIPQAFHGREEYVPWLAKKIRTTPLKRESLVVLPAGVPGIVDTEEMELLEPLRKMARMKHLNIIAGAFQRTKIPGRVFNTSIFLNHRGDMATYHKRTILEEEGRERNVIRGTDAPTFFVRQNETEFRVAPFIDHDLIAAQTRNGAMMLPKEYDNSHLFVVQNSFADPNWMPTITQTISNYNKPLVFSSPFDCMESTVHYGPEMFSTPKKEGLHYLEVPVQEDYEEVKVLGDY